MKIGRVTDERRAKWLIRHRVGAGWRVLAGIIALCSVGAFAMTLASGGLPRRERDVLLLMPVFAALFGYVAWKGRVPGWFAVMQGEQANDD